MFYLYQIKEALQNMAYKKEAQYFIYLTFKNNLNQQKSTEKVPQTIKEYDTLICLTSITYFNISTAQW